MSKTKIIIAAFVAALALSAMAAGSASAAGWHVNGVELTGSETRALSTVAVNDGSAVLNVPALPLKITCTGNLDGVSPLIKATNGGSAASLKFQTCSVIEPTTCSLETPEIKTNEVEATVSTVTKGDHVLFKPKSGTKFAEFVLLGSSCSISGKKAVTGTVVLNAPTGQTENTLQLLEGLGSLEQGVDSLQTAADPSYIEGGKALLKLESGLKWSFH
jgi:hypothetical protein